MLCAVVYGCVGCGTLDLPEPPDMTELVQAYNAPTGNLTAENAGALWTDVMDIADEMRVASPVELANDVTTDLSTLGGQSEEPPAAGPDDGLVDSPGPEELNGNRIDLAAIAVINRVCGGWEAAEAEANANRDGLLQLTATFDSAGFIPTIWGSLRTCRFSRSDFRAELDGELRIHFGDGEERVPLRSLRRVAYLVEFDGDVLVRASDETELEFSTRLHFKYVPPSEIQLLVDVPGQGAVIVLFNAESLDPPVAAPLVEVGLWTRAARYRCAISTDNLSGRCEDETDASAVISW